MVSSIITNPDGRMENGLKKKGSRVLNSLYFFLVLSATTKSKELPFAKILNEKVFG